MHRGSQPFQDSAPGSSSDSSCLVVQVPHDDIPPCFLSNDEECEQANGQQHVAVEGMEKRWSEEEPPDNGDGEHDGEPSCIDGLRNDGC